MKKPPKFKKESLFTRKMVITIPPWGVPIVAAAVALSIGVQLTNALVIFLFVAVMCSFTAVWAEHRMVKELRHTIYNIMHGIEMDEIPSGDRFVDFCETDQETSQAEPATGTANGHNKRISVKR